VPELESLGHEAIAIDLPGHGDRRSESATLEGYSQAILEVLESNDVVVGHSMAGAVITAAADSAPEKIRHLIYLAASVPGEGQSIMDDANELPVAIDMAGVEASESELWCRDSKSVSEMFYGDCTPEDQVWAFDQLGPQAILPIQTQLHLERFWTSTTPRSYIACLADRSTALPAMESTLRRLRIRVAYTIWSSHSPFISRPRDLALLFDDIVTNPVGADPLP